MHATRSALCLALLATLATAPAIAAADKPRAGLPGVSVRLLFAAEEFDPSKPAKAVVKCAVRNDTQEAVRVPAGYDGRAVVLRSGLLTLLPAPDAAGQPASQVKFVRLDPGREQTVFELPLDAIFGVGDSPPGVWHWDWPRRPEPPRSPIHRYRQAGFVSEARFTVCLTVAGRTVESSPVVLKVQPGP